MMHGQKNIKLCIKLVIWKSLCYDARSEKRKFNCNICFCFCEPGNI